MNIRIHRRGWANLEASGVKGSWRFSDDGCVLSTCRTSRRRREASAYRTEVSILNIRFTEQNDAEAAIAFQRLKVAFSDSRLKHEVQIQE